MSHPNEQLIRQLFDTWRTDRKQATAFFAEDAIFSYPGPGALHGEWQGREGILSLWAEQDRASSGRFWPEVLDMAAGDRHVFLMIRVAPVDGSSSWRRVVTYEISNGVIFAARVFEDAPVAAEAFFAQGDAAVLDFTHVRVGEGSLAYVEQGHGTPVILIHGSGATDARTWGSQLEPFAQHHHVIAYSQRYHYPNSWIGDGSDAGSTAVHCADLAGLIDALRLGRVHLVGSSFGAEIALRFTVEHPQQVRSLVVAEPGLSTWLVSLPGGEELFADYAATMLPARQAVLNGDLETGVRLFIDAVLGAGLFDHLPPSTQARLMDNARLLSVESTDIDQIVTDITREQAAAIRTPTLILVGDDSPQMFLMVSRELARLMPQAEQATIAGAAHLLHGMNPTAFNAAVLTFLAKHND